MIPIRDDAHLQGELANSASAFGKEQEADRFSFRLNIDQEVLVDLFKVPEDLPLTIRPSLWFLFQAGSDDWEYIVAGKQLAACSQDGYLRFPRSWYDRIPVPDTGIDIIASNLTDSEAAVSEVADWQTAAVDPTQPLPTDLPTRSTWLTRGYDGIVITQQRVQWTADLLIAALATVEVEQHFEYNSYQFNNRCHNRLDRIRGPPHTS